MTRTEPALSLRAGPGVQRGAGNETDRRVAPLTFVTPTFGADRERFLLQRESIVRCEIDIHHLAVVETEDLARFSSLPWSDGLTVVPTAEVLPPRIERLRRAGRQRWAGRLPWFRLAGDRVAGWFSQQLAKLAAGSVVDGDWVCLDSDVAFIRSMTPADFRSGRGRLLLVALDGLAGPEVREYRRRAERFFGIEPLPDDSEAHYTTPVAPISAATVERLLVDLERRGAAPWWEVLRREDLTEFATYGVFAERVEGLLDVDTADPRWVWLYYPGDPLPLEERVAAVMADGSFPTLMVHSHGGFAPERVRAALEPAWRATRSER